MSNQFNLFFYNNELSAPPELEDTHLVTLDKQLIEKAGNQGGTLVNGVLTFQGARLTETGISVYADVNLSALYDIKQLTQDDLHAGALFTVAHEDVTAETYQSLTQYAKQCEGKEFRSGRLQLVPGSGAFHAVAGFAAEAGILLEISQRENQKLNAGKNAGKEVMSYVIDSISFFGVIGFGNALGGSGKVGTVKKAAVNPWGKPQVQAAAPALTRTRSTIPATSVGIPTSPFTR